MNQSNNNNNDGGLLVGIDQMDLGLITGWARYRDSDALVELELVLNGMALESVCADLYQAELCAHRADGRFAFRIEPELDAGAMQLCLPPGARVYLQDVKSGQLVPESLRIWDGQLLQLADNQEKQQAQVEGARTQAASAPSAAVLPTTAASGAMGANVEYWQQYYAQHSSVSPPDYPSQFASFMLGLNRPVDLVVDLGCGSGRDALFFAQQGLQVVGLDYADVALQDDRARAHRKGLEDRLRFLRCDVTDFGEVEPVLSVIEDMRQGGRVAVYSRFFFHAIDEEAEGAALGLVKRLLHGAGDFAAFEFRTEHDQWREKVTPEHYRRYINVERFVKRAQEEFALACVYRTEGLGYSLFGADDAHVARLVFVRSKPGVSGVSLEPLERPL